MSSPITITIDGTLLNWTKQVGESVQVGDVVAEVEADKTTVEIAAEGAGVLLSQDVQPGSAISAGQVIGQIGASGAAAQATAGLQAARESGAQIIQNLGGTDVAAPATAALEAARASGAQIIQNLSNGHRSPAAQATAALNSARAEAAEILDGLPGGVKATPVARKMADQRGIDLRQVRGSGPGGRIVKEDVEHYQPLAPVAPVVAQPSAAPAAAASALAAPTRKLPAESADVEITDATTMRKRIAAVTLESNQQIPHFYVTMEVDMGPVLALRKQINESLPDDAKVTVNDLVVKATALTLRQFPNLNTHFYGDKLVHYKRINIGIAVSLPNNGLMYVVAKDADKTAISVMAAQNKAMIARAREGKVRPEDISGATFSTSNLGAYEVESFGAIISPPEAGILAVGSAKRVPIVLADGSLGTGERMKATVAVDHRISDGAEAAQFMQAFKRLIEAPLKLLV